MSSTILARSVFPPIAQTMSTPFRYTHPCHVTFDTCGSTCSSHSGRSVIEACSRRLHADIRLRSGSYFKGLRILSHHRLTAEGIFQALKSPCEGNSVCGAASDMGLSPISANNVVWTLPIPQKVSHQSWCCDSCRMLIAGIFSLSSS